MTTRRPDAGTTNGGLGNGSITDANIRASQKHAGIAPATGHYAKDLEEISRAAFELIKIVELEASGIRDDGYWHGSDALYGTLKKVGVLSERVKDDRPEAAMKATHAGEIHKDWLGEDVASDKDPIPF